MVFSHPPTQDKIAQAVEMDNTLSTFRMQRIIIDQSAARKIVSIRAQAIG